MPLILTEKREAQVDIIMPKHVRTFSVVVNLRRAFQPVSSTIRLTSRQMNSHHCRLTYLLAVTETEEDIYNL